MSTHFARGATIRLLSVGVTERNDYRGDWDQTCKGALEHVLMNGGMGRACRILCYSRSLVATLSPVAHYSGRSDTSPWYDVLAQGLHGHGRPSPPVSGFWCTGAGQMKPLAGKGASLGRMHLCASATLASFSSSFPSTVSIP